MSAVIMGPLRPASDKELLIDSQIGDNYRTLMPDRLVYILAAMFIDANSWKSSFAA